MTNNEKCWEWTGSRNLAGYGIVRQGGKTKRFHRVIFEIVYGAIPDGYEILHDCDNPICFNPSHLRAGTHAENMADAAKRLRLPTGIKHLKSKISDEQVLEIRSKHALGYSINELAKEYSLHNSYVNRIVNGYRRTNIQVKDD